jgi:hypothetical protein
LLNTRNGASNGRELLLWIYEGEIAQFKSSNVRTIKMVLIVVNIVVARTELGSFYRTAKLGRFIFHQI